jgi:hypothetical protein
VKSVADVVKAGDSVRVKVLSVDAGKGRIALSMKGMGFKPSGASSGPAGVGESAAARGGGPLAQPQQQHRSSSGLPAPDSSSWTWDGHGTGLYTLGASAGKQRLCSRECAPWPQPRDAVWLPPEQQRAQQLAADVVGVCQQISPYFAASTCHRQDEDHHTSSSPSPHHHLQQTQQGLGTDMLANPPPPPPPTHSPTHLQRTC